MKKIFPKYHVVLFKITNMTVNVGRDVTIATATTRIVKTTLFIDFFSPVLLIYTNKVLFRVNMQPQTLQAISIPCPTIVGLKFNQCKLHVTSYLIFLHQTRDSFS